MKETLVLALPGLVEEQVAAFRVNSSLESITFDGRDPESGLIRCSASLKMLGSEVRTPVSFSRQPQAGSRDFVYRATWDGPFGAEAIRAFLPPSSYLEPSVEPFSTDGSVIGEQGFYDRPPGTEARAPLSEMGTPAIGDDYMEARQSMTAAGWVPRKGENGFSVCLDERLTDTYFEQCPSTEIALPEVDDCAGTGLGYCRTVWTSPSGRPVVIITAGEPQPGGIHEVFVAD